jgi:hypothetical protein
VLLGFALDYWLDLPALDLLFLFPLRVDNSAANG